MISAILNSRININYRFAASSPGVAFDCSGLTAWAWAQAGVSLPHQSRAQYASVAHIPTEAAQPGDLIFFYDDISHVGIYIGNGMMIHAPKPGAYVREESIYYDGESAIHSVVRPA